MLNDVYKVLSVAIYSKMNILYNVSQCIDNVPTYSLGEMDLKTLTFMCKSVECALKFGVYKSKTGNW